MSGGWTKIYDLAEDQELISKVQKATLDTQDYGLVPEVALFGSKEWWEAKKFRRIKKICLAIHHKFLELLSHLLARQFSEE